jgi:transcriptional regulator GlxA family with amidase domain
MPEFQNFFHERALTARDERPWETARSFSASTVAITHPKSVATRESVSLPGSARSIASIIAFMLGNLDKPQSVPALSAMAGMSNSHFYSRFKCETGYSPLDFFIRARIDRACELLLSTRRSVKEIAELMGYDDQFYFSRRFKSVKGVAPKVYRRNQRKPELQSGNTALKPAGNIETVSLHRELRTQNVSTQPVS